MKNLLFVICVIGLIIPQNIDAQIIAQQDFNSLTAGAFTLDQLPSGVQLTNSGSMNVGGPGLDFTSTWFNTRGETLGPVTTSGDASDFIGVNSFTGLGAPDVSAAGVPVSPGVEQNFEFNDTDGSVVLNFEAVDVSGFTNRTLSLNYWINNTGYETGDAFTISLSNGGLGIVVLGFGDTELEFNAATAEDSPASWRRLTVDLDGVLASSGLSPTNLVLSIAVDVDSGTENIFVDDVVFASQPPAPCNISSLTANFLPCFDGGGTSQPDDDTFIADFTIDFTNPPTTGDIVLEVGGSTYSTSVVGLGTRFQFLSIPLQADGQPVVATARFTDDANCTLTTTVGTAPSPCSPACSIDNISASFLSCNTNNTLNLNDDILIVDFTVDCTNAPTIGDLQLEVDGQTYSMPSPGGTTQVVFSNIPVVPTDMDILASASFTAIPSCTLTDNVGMSTIPCPIPTLSQWGMIILLLSMINIVVLAIKERQFQLLSIKQKE